MQLASNVTEMQEMTAHLRWLNEVWPRRLMSAGSASNYMTVNQVEGAAFVGDCASCHPPDFYPAMRAHLESLGVEFRVDPAIGLSDLDAEIVIVAAAHRSLQILGRSGRWLFAQSGVIYRCESVDEPWNEALVGIESHRGHLVIRPDTRRGWLIAGMAPESDGHAGPEYVDPRLVEVLSTLSGERLSCLEGVITSEPRAVVYTCTADGLPAVGPLPGSARNWLMAGFAGRSWSLGPALGEQVALALLGEPTPHLAALPCLRPARWLSA